MVMGIQAIAAKDGTLKAKCSRKSVYEPGGTLSQLVLELNFQAMLLPAGPDKRGYRTSALALKSTCPVTRLIRSCPRLWDKLSRTAVSEGDYANAPGSSNSCGPCRPP